MSFRDIDISLMKIAIVFFLVTVAAPITVALILPVVQHACQKLAKSPLLVILTDEFWRAVFASPLKDN